MPLVSNSRRSAAVCEKHWPSKSKIHLRNIYTLRTLALHRLIDLPNEVAIEIALLGRVVLRGIGGPVPSAASCWAFVQQSDLHSAVNHDTLFHMALVMLPAIWHEVGCRVSFVPWGRYATLLHRLRCP